MTPEQLQRLVREQESFVFDRMFGAMEKVRERLDRACAALGTAKIPYAVIGGNAVAAWVATVDDGAVRTTRAVDLLVREADLERVTEALEAAGFRRDQVMDVIVFLDGENGKPSQGIHLLLAGRKVKPDYATATPDTDKIVAIEGKQIIDLEQLVGMKLNSYRRKDQTHLIDLIGVGLVDETWPSRFPPPLDERLQQLIDDPDG
jgi:hypothetical protein